MADKPPIFNQETWEAWHSHPLTALWRQFLTDNRDKLGRQWMEGQSMEPGQQVKALLMGEMASLGWPDVATFYEIPLPEPDESPTA